MSQSLRKNISAATNRLWIARKRAGYPLKWVAQLLDKRSLASVSEYESGRKLPSLATALRLEILYRMPLSELFPDLYASLAAEVRSVRARLPQVALRDSEMSHDKAAPHQ